MIIKIIRILCLILYCQFCFMPTAKASQISSSQTKDEVNSIEYYKTIAISMVDTYKKIPNKGNVFLERKILIQPLVPNSNHTRLNTPTLGQPIWTITAEQLPVTEDMCLNIDFEQPCITNGFQIIAFDEKRGKLYLSVATKMSGTAGEMRFTFVADINKKQIKYIHNDFGPLDGYLSPSGKYLLIVNEGQIKIYNTQTNDTFVITKQFIFDPPEKARLYYFNKIKWLSDTQFSYNEDVYHDKFQHNPDGITEYTFDIPSQKTIQSRTLKAYRFEMV